jgi:dGTPase
LPLLLHERFHRLHPRDRKPDQRREAQRDRDRVLYTSALRRLGHVTQVVSPTEGIVFHNRLTHTHEVAQIGRRIAERLTADEEGLRTARRLGGIDPDVVETAALVHDLGHPPYGHAVEQELNYLVSIKHAVHDGYEGNAQSFRIVTKLAMRHRRFPGLNLTRASLNASLKYPWFRARENEDERKHKKWGAYETEEREFEWVRKIHHGGRPDTRCVEAEIMDWSDDVAYAVHDVDDFYRAGLIPLDRLRNQADFEVDRFCRYAAPRLDRNTDEVNELLRSVVAASPIIEPYIGTDEQRQQLRTFTAELISKYVTAVDIANDQGEYPLLKIPPYLRAQVDVLKELTWFYVIDNRSIKTQQHGQRTVVKNLFKIYLDAGVSEDADVRGILPESQKEQLRRAETKEEQVRIVADLISSMTEQQLMMTHRKLTGIELGSITDLI